jgi:hypothetical protein
MKRKEPPDGHSKILRQSTRRKIVPNPLSRTAQNTVYSTGRFCMAGSEPHTVDITSLPPLPLTKTEPRSNNAVELSASSARRIVFPSRSLLNKKIPETTELEGIYFPLASPALDATGSSIFQVYPTVGVGTAASIHSTTDQQKVSPIRYGYINSLSPYSPTSTKSQEIRTTQLGAHTGTPKPPASEAKPPADISFSPVQLITPITQSTVTSTLTGHLDPTLQVI